VWGQVTEPAVGIPILSSVAATPSVPLTSIHLALSVDVSVTLASAVLPWLRLRPRDEPARRPLRPRQRERPPGQDR